MERECELGQVLKQIEICLEPFSGKESTESHLEVWMGWVEVWMGWVEVWMGWVEVWMGWVEVWMGWEGWCGWDSGGVGGMGGGVHGRVRGVVKVGWVKH